MQIRSSSSFCHHHLIHFVIAVVIVLFFKFVLTFNIIFVIFESSRSPTVCSAFVRRSWICAYASMRLPSLSVIFCLQRANMRATVLPHLPKIRRNCLSFAKLWPNSNCESRRKSELWPPEMKASGGFWKCCRFVS